jgi:hypothetical protein
VIGRVIWPKREPQFGVDPEQFRILPGGDREAVACRYSISSLSRLKLERGSSAL